jgi:hypothetical protein
LFNAGWNRKHQQDVANQLQQQVDTVLRGNSQKSKKLRFNNNHNQAEGSLSPALNKYQPLHASG